MSDANTNVRKSLKDRALSMATNLPLMEGKTKADQKALIGEIVTISDFGFMPGDSGDFAVFTVLEYPENFFFAGMVLTDDLKKFEAEGYMDDIKADGLPVLFSMKKSKNKQMYTNVMFYPETTLKTELEKPKK